MTLESELRAIEEKKRRASARFIGFFSKIEKKKPETADKTECELWYKPFEVRFSKYFAIATNLRRLSQEYSNKYANLYQFHDNYRPPYYGTWRIRSNVVTGRRPFTTEDENIDYEVDSDAEWEDEPSDAEECKSDEEKDGTKDSHGEIVKALAPRKGNSVFRPHRRHLQS
ncbi:unnamed protein product [Angiostrongylus costaricensis]|uniref:Chromatin assembly factor 1 subunit A n=1 Tax=Angiostrongylus costaricensis TaxID=334426 RepID=A0A0R3PUR7_ANGCS|nr:unnamed protein product [Angiostrongylus costaricensis]